MISFVLPTRNRSVELAITAESLASLEIEGAELVVIDNASDEPKSFGGGVSGLAVTEIELPRNLGAAARNMGVRQARHDWVVMLDDDSHLLDRGVLDAIADASPRTGALMADVVLPDGAREQGGLPEVFIGCGAAIRRDLFLELGGYDHSFGYYVEEYDFCARLVAHGSRVDFDPRFRVRHRKVQQGRDFGAILHRLVRNNGWMLARAAPDSVLETEMDLMLQRYASIAEQNNCLDSFAAAQSELRATVESQHRTPMAGHHWDRFTGYSAAVEAFASQIPESARTAAIVEPGKGEPVIRRALADHGLIIVGDAQRADVVTIGTLSPGPMFDAMDRFGQDPRVIAPWVPAEGFRPSRVAAA